MAEPKLNVPGGNDTETIISSAFSATDVSLFAKCSDKMKMSNDVVKKEDLINQMRITNNNSVQDATMIDKLMENEDDREKKNVPIFDQKEGCHSEENNSEENKSLSHRSFTEDLQGEEKSTESNRNVSINEDASSDATSDVQSSPSNELLNELSDEPLNDSSKKNDQNHNRNNSSHIKNTNVQNNQPKGNFVRALNRRKKYGMYKLEQNRKELPDNYKDILEMTEDDIQFENKNPTLRNEKQEVLFQLLKNYPEESHGQWNMQVPLFELKYELLRREQHKEQEAQVHFMKEMLKLMLKGLEVLNRKLGNYLALDGWSDYATSDMKKYDRCMKALYHRYFKRKQMNPVTDLLFLIVGSAAMYHLQNRFLGGGSAFRSSRKTESFNDMHDIRPPPGIGVDPNEEVMGDQNSGMPNMPSSGLNLSTILNMMQ
jgi:hypothetical protein